MSLSLSLKKTGRHLVFWMVVALLYYTIEATRGKPELFGFIVIRQLPSDIITAYFTYYIIVEKFLLEKRYWLASLLLIASSIIFTLIAWTVFYYQIIPTVYPDSIPPVWLHGPGMIQSGIGLYYIAFLFSGLKLFQKWISEKSSSESKKQNLNNTDGPGLFKIIVPDYLKIPIQQYLTFFGIFVEKTKGYKILFDVKEIEEGIKVEFSNAMNITNEYIISWIKEYMNLVKSTETALQVNFEINPSEEEANILFAHLQNQISNLTIVRYTFRQRASRN